MYRSTLWKKNEEQDLFEVWGAGFFLFFSFQFSQFIVKTPSAEAQYRPFGHKGALRTVGFAIIINPLRTLILGFSTLFPVVSNITQGVSSSLTAKRDYLEQNCHW